LGSIRTHKISGLILRHELLSPNRRRRSPLREASLAEGHLRARPGELSTRFCETEQVLQPSSPGVALSPRRPRSQTGPPSVIRCQKVSRRN
jgi:hypothetical protein